MKSMTLGYARVSTMDQNLDRQLDRSLENVCKGVYNIKKILEV